MQCLFSQFEQLFFDNGLRNHILHFFHTTNDPGHIVLLLRGRPHVAEFILTRFVLRSTADHVLRMQIGYAQEH